MKRTTRTRFWVEGMLACLSGLLCVVTLMWRDWIEVVFRVDPDHHNGSLEWLIVLALLGASISLGGLAVKEFRKPASTA